MLPSLHIEGFRCFRELTIERLGRVNLIVGKNNVGKTTLLDALRVHAAQDDALYVLEDMLERRGEILRFTRSAKPSQRVVDWLRAFFHDPQVKEIQIGPCGKLEETLRLAIRSSGPGQLFKIGGRASGELINAEIGARSGSVILGEALQPRPVSEHVILCQYIPSTGLSAEESSQLWDSVVLTEYEESCLQALRIIEPGIQRIALVDVPAARREVERAPHVLRASRAQPEPLRSLGEGMNRIFDIILGMTNARGGRLLIDEIENGLHYSIHETLWRHLFEVASKLDVQVFATTHSWGCIDAFQAAARAHPDDGILIRLDRRESESIAFLFDEDDLAVVSEQAIEVR
jgi:AAA domain, putative AbiEii toxin, Type IV TA system/AAA domain